MTAIVIRLYAKNQGNSANIDPTLLVQLTNYSQIPFKAAPRVKSVLCVCQALWYPCINLLPICYIRLSWLDWIIVVTKLVNSVLLYGILQFITMRKKISEKHRNWKKHGNSIQNSIRSLSYIIYVICSIFIPTVSIKLQRSSLIKPLYISRVQRLKFRSESINTLPTSFKWLLNTIIWHLKGYEVLSSWNKIDEAFDWLLFSITFSLFI